MFKIAFLFLTIASAFHEDYWQDFFKGHEKHYSIYVHAKHQIESNSFLTGHEIPEKVPTEWAITMRAQNALLRNALKDPENQKFIFISESTIPFQSFDFVYEAIMSHDRSMFYFEKSPHLDPSSLQYDPRRIIQGIPIELQCKHSQWIVLNRKHAHILANDTIFSNHKSCYDQEHYPGTLLAFHNVLNEVLKNETTYVCWPHKTILPGAGHPITFTNLQDPEQIQLVTNAINNGFLFGRKFAKECNLSLLDPLLTYRN